MARDAVEIAGSLPDAPRRSLPPTPFPPWRFFFSRRDHLSGARCGRCVRAALSLSGVIEFLRGYRLF